VRRGGRGRGDGEGGAPQRRAPGVRPTGHRSDGAASGRRQGVVVVPLRRRRDRVRGGPRRRRRGRPRGGAPGGADLLRAPRRDAAPPPHPRRGRRARGQGQHGARQGRRRPAVLALPPPPAARRGGAARVPGPRGGVRGGGRGLLARRGEACGGGGAEAEGGVPGREGVEVLPRPDLYPGERVDPASTRHMCLSGGDESLAGAWSDGVAAPEIDGAGSVLDATQSSGMRNGFGAVGLGGNRMRVYVTCVGLDASVNTRNLRTVAQSQFGTQLLLVLVYKPAVADLL